MTKNNLRKLLSLLLSFLLIFSLVSCGNNTANTTTEYADEPKTELTEDDIERVKSFAIQHIYDFEGINVEITGYKILHDIETDLPNAVDVTFVSDEKWTLGSETHDVDGYVIVELKESGLGEFAVTISSMCNPSYYANTKEEWKLYYSSPFGYYYKKEGSDIFYHTVSSAHNIVPGEYKDPTLSY